MPTAFFYPLLPTEQVLLHAAVPGASVFVKELHLPLLLKIHGNFVVVSSLCHNPLNWKAQLLRRGTPYCLAPVPLRQVRLPKLPPGFRMSPYNVDVAVQLEDGRLAWSALANVNPGSIFSLGRLPEDPDRRAVAIAPEDLHVPWEIDTDSTPYLPGAQCRTCIEARALADGRLHTQATIHKRATNLDAVDDVPSSASPADPSRRRRTDLIRAASRQARNDFYQRGFQPDSTMAVVVELMAQVFRPCDLPPDASEDVIHQDTLQRTLNLERALFCLPTAFANYPRTRTTRSKQGLPFFALINNYIESDSSTGERCLLWDMEPYNLGPRDVATQRLWFKPSLVLGFISLVEKTKRGRHSQEHRDYRRMVSLLQTPLQEALDMRAMPVDEASEERTFRFFNANADAETVARRQRIARATDVELREMAIEDVARATSADSVTGIAIASKDIAARIRELQRERSNYQAHSQRLPSGRLTRVGMEEAASA